MDMNDVQAAVKSGKITQADLVRESGIHQPTVSSLINGNLARQIVEAAERLLKPRAAKASKVAGKGVSAK